MSSNVKLTVEHSYLHGVVSVSVLKDHCLLHLLQMKQWGNMNNEHHINS